MFLPTIRPFILDNTLRECAVAAVKAVTLEDKLKMLEYLKPIGFEHFILGALSDYVRPDDQFVAKVLSEQKNP